MVTSQERQHVFEVPNSNRLIAWLTGILTLVLALFSFILSFNALTDMAALHQISIPYLFPLVVEAGVIIFSLNALYRSLHGEHARWQWVMIIFSSLVAGTFNVLHAEPQLVSQVMAAMPSLFLLLSFESFLGQVKHAVKRAGDIAKIEDIEAQVAALEQEKGKLADEVRQLDGQKAKTQDEISQAKARADQIVREATEKADQLVREANFVIPKGAIGVEQRQGAVLVMSKMGIPIKEQAGILDVSERTIKNDRQSFNGLLSG